MTEIKNEPCSITDLDRCASIIGAPNEAAVRARRRFWSRPDRWPVDPPGHVFLARLVNEVGTVMFPGYWTGHEWNESAPPPFPHIYPKPQDQDRAYRILAAARPDQKRPLPPPRMRVGNLFLIKLSAAEYQEARQILDRVCEVAIPAVERYEAVTGLIISHCMAGSLKGYRQSMLGGQFSLIAETEWFYAVKPWAHFDSCKIDPLLGRSPDGAGGQWIFVERGGLNQLLPGATTHKPERTAANGRLTAIAQRPKGKPGAKARFDWEDIETLVFQILEKKGDFDAPDTTDDWKSQNALIKKVIYYIERPSGGVGAGKGPADSTLKGRITPMVRRWRDSKASAEN